MEGGIRVPFIVMGPGINERSYKDTPISFSDLLPTISDIAGNEILKKRTWMVVVLRNYYLIKVIRCLGKKGLIFHVPYENKIALESLLAIIVDNYKLIKL